MTVLKKIKRILNRKWIVFYNSVYLIFLKTFNKNKSFTIISNNCWGGTVYQDLNLPYLTPTIGLFFYAPDYIKFVENLDHYINQELKFSNDSKFDEANEARKSNFYPIGVLDDIEIQFLHYESEKEAYEKWNKRKKRINYNNLFLKFDDRDLSTFEYMMRFDKIKNVKNKVIFSARKNHDIKSLVYLSDFKGENFIGDISTYKNSYRKNFNVLKWLNTK